MASLTQTVQAPTDTTDGLRVTIERSGGIAIVRVSHTDAVTGIHTYAEIVPLADLTPSQRTTLTNVVQALLAIATPRMGFV